MNNKPRYNEGTVRHQIVNLLHVTGVITPRCYKLFDSPSMANVAVKLKKEGIIEKNNNTEVFENLSLQNYSDNYEKYFYENLSDDNLEFFSDYAKKDIKKARNSKKKESNKAMRILHNAEVVAFMHAAKIPTLPNEKKHIVKNLTLTDNIYYQSREIKKYSGYTDDIEEEDDEKNVIATRMHGCLLSSGGNYVIYHLGKQIQTWTAKGEYKIKYFIQSLLSNYINRNSCMVENAILLTYNLTEFLKLINPSKKLKASHDGLNMTYENLYALPFDKNGRDLLKIMSKKDWEVKMMEYIMEEEYVDTSRLDTICDYYDKESKLYTIIFCVPNIKKYLGFMQKAVFVNEKDNYQVVCFDFQYDFVKASIGQYAHIATMDFDMVKEYFNISDNPTNQIGNESDKE